MKFIYALAFLLSFEGVDCLSDAEYEAMAERNRVYEAKKVEQHKEPETASPKPRYHGYAFRYFLNDSSGKTYYFEHEPIIKGQVITFVYLGDEYTFSGNWCLVEYK